MKKNTIFFLLLCICPMSFLSAQMQQEWVARYDGSPDRDDIARAVAVDLAGNVYVTGESCTRKDPSSGDCLASEYVTIKYDSAGNQLWLRRYSGPGNGADSATSIAADGEGNVFVAGSSWGAGTLTDFVTIRYNSSGDQMWVARYNGPGNANDRAAGMVLGADGSVYVTGESQGTGSDFDYATIKYDSAGNPQWVARYDGPENGFDTATAIALGSDGSVYVGGGSGGAKSMDFAAIKYDAEGNQVWAARFDGPGDTNDRPAAIAVDDAGNVYVTGQSEAFGGADYATVKYDAEGRETWNALFHRPDHRDDAGTGIVVDAQGNVYVTGRSIGDETNYDYVTLKYDSNGTELWTAVYNGAYDCHDIPSAIKLDGAGNIYITGRSRGDGSPYEYLTLKYDPDGNEVARVAYLGPYGRSYGNALALDADGNAYVTGQSRGSDGVHFDYATVKYSQR